jgi:hypothetical protein
MHTNAHEFAAKKKQGKIRAMQSHGQVMPPCDCIAKITAEAEAANYCATGAKWGGEVIDNIGS